MWMKLRALIAKQRRHVVEAGRLLDDAAQQVAQRERVACRERRDR